jgi:hypothetical protein
MSNPVQGIRSDTMSLVTASDPLVTIRSLINSDTLLTELSKTAKNPRDSRHPRELLVLQGKNAV